jgi:hypothetical protein
MVRRLGFFLFWIGLFLGFLFITSDLVETPNYVLLLVSFVSFTTGMYILNRTKKPPEPSGRFRFIRGLGKKKSKEEKENSGN